MFKKNSNAFAWSAVDMSGVDLQVIVHNLNVLQKKVSEVEEEETHAVGGGKSKARSS